MSYSFVLPAGTNGAVCVNSGPGRTATLTNLGGGVLRQCPVDGLGNYGSFTNIAEGASQTVTLLDPHVHPCAVGAGRSPDRDLLMASLT